jgi:glutamyl-tRNA synthetase
MNKESENIEISNMLFPDLKQSKNDLLKRYPKRDLNEDQLVLRFAPSPTGFLHMGSVYTSLIGYFLIKKTKGLFILRIEDTDKNREVRDGIEQMIEGFEYFGIKFDEGWLGENQLKGDYGPYLQSQRLDIYRVFAKDLVSRGLAYPCFSSKEELESIRRKQEQNGEKTGYYGKWAKWRDASSDEIKEQLEKGTSFVVRLYSNGKSQNKINCMDLIKGGVTLSENDMDSVLLKSDGFPTYHFAHPIDDSLMDISFVLRGDEWLSSQPLHMEIFKALGFKQLNYGHLSPLMKSEDGGKRKLSKRKDPEFAVSFYIEKGYPVYAVKDYLLNIANSNFTDWRRENPKMDILDFDLRLEKFNRAGTLFDIKKLEDICKEYISTLSAEEVYEEVVNWAKEFNDLVHTKLVNHKGYCISILNIEREGEKIRKDIIKWSDVNSQFEIFFEDMFKNIQKDSMDIEKNLQIEILNSFLDTYYFGDDSYEWFRKIKDIALRNGFCTDIKEYKKEPRKYNGKVGDVAMIIRVAITGKKQTPDLYQVMQVMGEDRVRERIKEYINTLDV